MRSASSGTGSPTWNDAPSGHECSALREAVGGLETRDAKSSNSRKTRPFKYNDACNAIYLTDCSSYGSRPPRND